jgi:hypothetical protein
LETLYPPATALAPVEETVVQPVLAALPELDRLGLYPVASPVQRAGYLSLPVLGLQLF